MYRDTRSAYRSRANATEALVNASVAAVEAEEPNNFATAFLRRRSAIQAGQYDAWRASCGAVNVAMRNPFLPSVTLFNFPESIGDWPISGDDLALAKAGVIA